MSGTPPDPGAAPGQTPGAPAGLPLPPAGPPTIRRRWFWLVLVLLVVSVMLNLFIAGVITGRMGGASGLALASLPREIRTVVRQELAAERQALLSAVREMRAARREVRAALIADPFDERATEAAFERLRRATDRVQVVMHAAFVRAADRLPAEIRAKLPDRTRFMRRLERRLNRL